MREFYERLSAEPFVALQVALKDGQRIIIQHPAEVERHIHYFILLPVKPDGTRVTIGSRDILRVEMAPNVLVDGNSI